ncbi:MAG: hypothetical protein JXR83_12920, partial [Deltaproteobacteria bacterium]|nr:hypothetical protein [Deltaproteobacteria bacterium]
MSGRTDAPGGARPGDSGAPDRGVDRRTFLEVLGGVAGATALAACRRPVECVVPVADRPEDLLPGEPLQYATALRAGPDVCGVLVRSLAGRPTKIEGNPKHPTSGGATSAFAQAELWELLDPDRSSRPWQRERPAGWSEFRGELEEVRRGLVKRGGSGLAIVVDATTSPTAIRLLQQTRARWPQTRLFVDDALTGPARAGLELLGRRGLLPRWRLDSADVIAAFDCDLLQLERGALRADREFAARRRVTAPVDEMSRLYVVEPT